MVLINPMESKNITKSDINRKIQAASDNGYVEVSLNVWAKKNEIMNNCDCIRLTKNGFVTVKKR